MPRVLKNLILLAVVSLLTLGVAEVVTRYAFGPPMGKLLPQVKYDQHPTRRFALRPGQKAYSYNARVAVDENGFRINGPGVVRRPRVRILALGDSFTFGMGVEDGETWPAQLERNLNRSFRFRTSIINAGTVSYNLPLELEQFREYISTTPKSEKADVLIHALYWNDYLAADDLGSGAPDEKTASVVDANGYLVWDRIPASYGFGRFVLESLSSRSSLLSLARRAGYALSRDAAGRDTGYARAHRRMVDGCIESRELEIVGRFYEDVLEITRKQHMELFVVVLPVIDILDRPDHPYPSAMRRVLDRLSIEYVDSFSVYRRPGLPGRTFLPQGHDAHLSGRGHRLIADELTRLLKDESAHFSDSGR